MEAVGWVFDLDGVLIHSEPIHMRSWQEVVRRRGRTLGGEWQDIGIGIPDAEFWPLAAGALGLDPSDASALEEKRKIFETIVQREGMPLCEGAQELLARLRPRYPLALATSSSRAFVDDVLEQQGWEAIFRVTLSRDDVERPKPDPEIFLKAALGLDLDPTKCIAVEDSPTGLAAAAAAGMRAIGVTTSFPAQRLQGAGLIVHSLGEIGRILDFAGAPRWRE